MSFESNDPVTTSTPLTPATPAPTPGASVASPSPATPSAPAVAVSAPARKKRGPVDWLLLGAGILAIGGVAFAVGRTTAPAAAADFTSFPGGGVTIQPGGSFDPGSLPQGGGPGGGNGGPAFFGNGGPTIEGTVTAISADSVTVKLASGDEVTLAVDRETTYHESTPADASTVQVGDEVAVRADGGRFVFGNGGGQGDQGQGADPGAGGAQDLTAGDVTVQR